MLKSKGKACFLGMSADSLAATWFPCSDTSHLGSFVHCAAFWAAPLCPWLRCFPSTGLAFPPRAVVPAVQKRLFLPGKPRMVLRDPTHRHSFIDTARAQLRPETTSSRAQRRHNTLGDHSQVVGWTQHPTLEAKGIPWTSWGLVLSFPWPQPAATPLGTSNLPRRHSREGEPRIRPRSNEVGLVKLGPCQDVPEVSTGSPRHACTPCPSHTHPPRQHLLPSPVLAAQRQRGPFPPLC